MTQEDGYTTVSACIYYASDPLRSSTAGWAQPGARRLIKFIFRGAAVGETEAGRAKVANSREEFIWPKINLHSELITELNRVVW